MRGGSIAIGSVVLLLAAGGAPAAAQEPPAQPATQTDNTVPPARVTVDGRPIGNTPVVNVAIPPGTHEIVIETLDGVRREPISVMLAPGEQMRIIRHLGTGGIQLQAQLSFSTQSGSGSGSAMPIVPFPPPQRPLPPRIRVQPRVGVTVPMPGAQGALVSITATQRARILVDGRLVGMTPRRFFLAAGRHRLDVVTDTGRRRKIVLHVRHGQPIRRHIRF
jgi:hypothetical protein